jgi:hypothetical protein
MFTVDAGDRIVKANDGFWSFARDNGWDPDPATVLGRPVWRFMADEGLAFLYRQLHKIAREQQKAFCFPLRCDSPDMIREMTVTIGPVDDDRLVYIIEPNRTIPRHNAISSPIPAESRLICPSCRRIECEYGWMPIEDAITRQVLEVGECGINLHSCPDCRSLETAMSKRSGMQH